ncbi:hypothetical protein PYCC9005_003968 [Savitreella phatthalungensis]
MDINYEGPRTRKKMGCFFSYCLPTRLTTLPDLQRVPVGRSGVQTLEERLIPTRANARRIIFIGDVHGCIRSLHELLKSCSWDETRDHVVFVGDLVAKGPRSLEVLDYVTALRHRKACTIIRGNHDDKLLRWYLLLQSLTDPHNHLQEINAASLPPDLKPGDEHRRIAASLKEEHVNMLEALPYVIRIPLTERPTRLLVEAKFNEYIVVHAGLLPGERLEAHSRWVVTHMREIRRGKASDGKDTRKGPNRDRFWWASIYSAQKGRSCVVYGHDASRLLRIGQEARLVRGLDTKCYAGNKLTALVVDIAEGETLVQVDYCG